MNKVSVYAYIAFQNEEKFIRQALESLFVAFQLLNDDYDGLDCGVVIVNDGSSDNSEEIVKALINNQAGLKILYVRNEVVLGLAASMNICMSVKLPDLVVRFDADDICAPNRLRRQFTFMSLNPNVDICGSGADLIDESGDLIGELIMPESHVEITNALRYKSALIHPSVMMRGTSLADVGGYTAFLKRGQDFDLWLRLMTNGAVFANIGEKLISYRAGSPRKKLRSNSMRLFYELCVGLFNIKPLVFISSAYSFIKALVK